MADDAARDRRIYRGPVKAVIFDWAGTVVDYGSRAPAAVFVDAFTGRGVPITVAEAREPMGRAKLEHIKAIMHMPRVAAAWREKHGREAGDADIDAVYTDFLELQRDSLGRYSDVIPGVPAVVEHCRQRGLMIGSSTGYTRELMDVVMPIAAAQGFVPDAMLCASDFAEGRPAPWLIFENARRLGVYPMAAIVKVDDTLAGIEAGISAGTWTVGVAKTGNELGLSAAEVDALDESELHTRLERARQRMTAAGAHFVIDGVSDLPPLLDEIDARLAAGETPL